MLFFKCKNSFRSKKFATPNYFYIIEKTSFYYVPWTGNNTMIYLILVMLIAGIIGRLTLLTFRGKTFYSNSNRKSIVRVLLELLGAISSLSSFIISFFLFEWWLPLVCLAGSYWIVAPLLVKPNTFKMFYNLQMLLTGVSIGCSLALLEMYFKFFEI